MDNSLDTGSQPADNQDKLSYTQHSMFEFDEKTLKDTNSSLENDEKQNSWISDSSSLKSVMIDEQVINVFDVAAYILLKIGTMTTMKLQKLVYYCQAWSLVWDEKLLFKENIEAWANGPVVRELFAYHRGMFQISSVSIGNPDLLNDDQKETVDAVIEYYGNKPSQWLIDLTHMEDPWKKARVGLPVSSRCDRVITLEDMAEYYSSLPPES